MPSVDLTVGPLCNSAVRSFSWSTLHSLALPLSLSLSLSLPPSFPSLIPYFGPLTGFSRSLSPSRIPLCRVPRPRSVVLSVLSVLFGRPHPRGINCGRHDYRNGDPGPGGCLFHGRLTKAYPVMPTRQDEIKDRDPTHRRPVRDSYAKPSLPPPLSLLLFIPRFSSY